MVKQKENWSDERMRKRRNPHAGLVWAYCRVSTQKEEQELSLDEQVGWAEEFARHRAARLVIFKDKASAKTVIARPQCAKLLGTLENDEAEVPEFLIATTFDRLSRDMTDTLLIARTLRQSGVKLYIRDRGEVAMDSFADQAAIVGQAMGGHAENEAKSNRCKASWERRHRQGKPMSNKSPYGLQLRAERDVVEPVSGPWVRKAFEWYASGIGMHTIALRLKAGAPPHRVVTSKHDVDGNPIVRERAHVWESNRVRKLLNQRRYRGTIVDAELFDQIQEAIGAKPRWRQERAYEYPLSGAVKCLSCGRSFHGHATGATGSKRRADGSIAVYRRYRRVRYYGCTVCHYMINADRLEQWFEDDIASIEADDKLFRRWSATERPSDMDTIIRERFQIEERLRNGSFDNLRQRAWQLALTDDSVKADLPRQLKTIAAEEAHTRDRLGEISKILDDNSETKRTEDLARRLLAEFKQLFYQAPYEQKRELANSLVAALGGVKASKDGLFWVRQGPRPVRKALVLGAFRTLGVVT
jgi:DNA invertase Pin-like site-specific DNA recombinase